MARPKGIPKTGGRIKGVPNKATADIRALAQEYGPRAITTLAGIMVADDQPAAARVSAAKELLERGYGKVSQPTELTGANGGPIETHDLGDRLASVPKAKRDAIRTALQAALGDGE